MVLKKTFKTKTGVTKYFAIDHKIGIRLCKTFSLAVFFGSSRVLVLIPDLPWSKQKVGMSRAPPTITTMPRAYRPGTKNQMRCTIMQLYHAGTGLISLCPPSALFKTQSIAIICRRIACLLKQEHKRAKAWSLIAATSH